MLIIQISIEISDSFIDNKIDLQYFGIFGNDSLGK